ncbi:MAG: ankyrin repeat domain-containing protein [Planctomycetes bacterium]|nr:ankyrin repeat domain-containing protein [Planctomycetota bacterium]
MRILKEAGARGDPETLIVATRVIRAAASGEPKPDNRGWEWPNIWFGHDPAFPLKQLLEWGQAADLADEDGLTPLMAAAAQGRTANVELLLKAGADPLRRDAHGNTALTLARPHPETEQAILRALPHD